MPTQASMLAKECSYQPNPEVHVSQTTKVIFTANIKVQTIMNLSLLTTAVYQGDILLQEA
jgi:hypothetical protein